MIQYYKQLSSLFSDRSISLLNIHHGILMLANHLAGIFSAIYLYKNGLDLWQVFLVWCGIFIVRFAVRPFSLWISLRKGLKKSLLTGILCYAVLYQILYQVNGLNFWLAVFIIFAAITDVFYWLPFHAFYALIGSEKTRGRDFGTREFLISITGIFAPAIGGFFIAVYGFFVLFLAASLLILASAIPILTMNDAPMEKNFTFRTAFKNVSKSGFWLFVGDGWYSTGLLFLWPIILFLMFNNYVTYGSLLTIALFFQSLGFIVLGSIIDSGKGKIVYKLALILGAFALVGRAAFAFTIPAVIFFDLLYAIVNCFYYSSLGVALYNSSRSSKNQLWFQYFAENGWDVGAFSLTLLAAGAAYFGLNVRLVFAATPAGLLLVWHILAQYFNNYQSNKQKQ
ncbi:hypothetical protein HYS31_05870 [Candidatus Woesearchaeota archaeon]|nr:hypothetical protein [Candidatus Woesearchaeota archaeon]